MSSKCYEVHPKRHLLTDFSKRMIMTRVRQWGIARNCNFDEMCAAIRLLGDQELDQAPMDTAFLIRGQQIPLNKILVYFRRKEISDPVAFVKGLPEDRLAEKDVQLCPPGSRSEPDSTQSSTLTPSFSESLNASLIQKTSSNSTPSSCGLQRGHQSSSSMTRVDLAMISPQIPNISPMRSPTQPSERLVWSITVYVDSYSASERCDSHHEPSVHHLTTHGQFGARVQEWIALMSGKGPRTESDQALTSINSAFDLIPELLNDHSPMNMAQVLTVICELLQAKYWHMVKMLVKHIYSMSKAQGKSEHTIGAFCAALNDAEDLSAGTIICIMQKAMETLTANRGRTDWRSLYLKERLCDALYHARIDYPYQRQKARQGLLADQKIRNGPNARNVLWTMAIVGDDLRLAGEFDSAKDVFDEVLSRAHHLEGYHKAKTRFPALEGLGLLYLDMAGHHRYFSQKTQLLRQAMQQFKTAEDEARRWFVFPMSTRRIDRILEHQRTVSDLLALQD